MLSEKFLGSERPLNTLGTNSNYFTDFLRFGIGLHFCFLEHTLPFEHYFFRPSASQIFDLKMYL